MGKIYLAQCSKCDYNIRLHLGNGLNSINIPFLTGCLSEKDALKLDELQEYGISQVIGCNQLIKRCSCSNGEPLYESVIVSVTDKDGKQHTLGNRCTECGKALEIIDISKPVPCPKCGEADLTLNIAGHWD